MLTQEQKDQYFRDGYLLIPNVLTAEQVNWLRAFFRPKFDAPVLAADFHHLLYDIFGRYPEVRWLCFHEPTLEIVRSLFGDDIVLLPDSAAHFNGFTGWHKDTGAYERAGFTFFREKEYMMWGLAYYLQDNTTEYGGGLDVEPGSHRETDDLFLQPPTLKERSVLQRIWHQINRSERQKYWLTRQQREARIYEPSDSISIPSKAGDLIVFDSRINHRATHPRRRISHQGWVARGVLPVEHEKLAVFSAWSRNNWTARVYVEFSRNRDDYVHLKDFSYPADFLKDAAKYGVNLVY
jgi:hypothetical protein